MPVYATVIHLQVASDSCYVKGFLAVHEHYQDSKPNRVSECPENRGRRLQVFGGGHLGLAWVCYYYDYQQLILAQGHAFSGYVRRHVLFGAEMEGLELSILLNEEGSRLHKVEYSAALVALSSI